MQTLAIAKGELWLHRDGQPPRQISSAFAREVIERDERSRRNTSWKHAPREQTGVIPGNTLWGSQQSGPMAPPRFLHAAFGPDTQSLYYVLRVGESTGLFRLHLDEDREVRLFHRSGIAVHGLTYNPGHQHLVLAIGLADGTAQLEVYDEEGTLKGAVTGGDCIDAAPAMVPGAASALVYQSSGVARHPQHGHVAAVAHATLCRLDYKSGQLDTLVDDRQHDFVAPKMAADGTLYAIRRPVEKPAHERAGGALVDTLMMPVRLLKAVFGYLNFFSTVYGKEPLRSAGGPRTPELDQDLGRLWLHGRMIELRKVRDDPQHAGNLVPASWELVRRPNGGSWQTLAKHVASFDLRANGSVVYTNGYQLTEWHDGRASPIGRHELVETVIAS
ncbi:MAG TPA: hypothetical protein VFY73_03635 [Ideonella sp.]|uniref:hypothetical protein n=1 Tax=Ideonella sp. TaxID=1929293 RepID=UPI002E36BD97|nr:hypothetical protein [Ideonella sp.]HEX5683107.1 hypothetical protein [Ideonella sp.]